jgi:hypothetical protein
MVEPSGSVFFLSHPATVVQMDFRCTFGGSSPLDAPRPTRLGSAGGAWGFVSRSPEGQVIASTGSPGLHFPRTVPALDAVAMAAPFFGDHARPAGA